MLPLITSSIGSLLGGGGVGGGVGAIGSMFGGEEPEGSAKSAATGTFTGGGLTITKSDDMLKIAFGVIGLILFMSILRKRK